MLYVFTENRKNDRSRNTNTGNWREQNLATFWVLNRKKMKYVGIWISTLFKNISCEKFVIEKKKRKKTKKKILVFLVRRLFHASVVLFHCFEISEQICSFVDFVNLLYHDKYSRFMTTSYKVYEVSKVKVTNFLCHQGHKTKRGRRLQR